MKYNYCYCIIIKPSEGLLYQSLYSSIETDL